jgi:penicillin-binding protein 1A
MQQQAYNAVYTNTLNQPGDPAGSLVAVDDNGNVRAMVGGRDYIGSSYNRATQANRQAGSSFKLFVYLTALEAGYRPDTILQDEPITIDGWSPRNSNGRFMGPIPIRIAFAYSVNTVAVRLAQQVGTSAVADMARRFGVTTRIETNPSMALGSNSVRLIDMTRAFASVARGGVAVTPYGIRRVTTADGTLLYQHPGDEPRVLVAPWVASQMTELLQGVVEHGTAREAQLGRPTAGKTGTTSSNKDGWFIGFSSGLTTGVWMGRDDNRALPGLSGGQAPARAFHDLMVRAVANRPVEQFQTDASGPEWEVQGGDNALLEIAPPNDEPFVDPDGNPVDRDSPPPRDDARPDEGLPPDDDRPPADDDEDNRDPRQAGAMAGAGA